jgi:hypothetical protein
MTDDGPIDKVPYSCSLKYAGQILDARINCQGLRDILVSSYQLDKTYSLYFVHKVYIYLH